MPFEELMSTVTRWAVATEALAAVGAELTLMREPEDADPETVAALRIVSEAAGLRDLSRLPSPQREMAIGFIRLFLHQSTDLIDNPGRTPGWAFTDPAILEGWGRGSAVVPAALSAAAPDLAAVRSFLDVGVGVGMLAIAAAARWPNASIVGIDIWGPSLEAAAANIRAAGLDGRITLREQDVATLDDTDTYDCAWFPTFFTSEGVFEAALPRLFHALRPGGWLVLGRMALLPDPLAEATSALRTVRVGGAVLDVERLVRTLEGVGCIGIRVLPRQGPAPLEYVIGQRPTA